MLAAALSGCAARDRTTDAEVSFPLDRSAHLSLGSVAADGAAVTSLLEWFAARLNIDLRAVPIGGLNPERRAAGLLELATAGDLPDLVALEGINLTPLLDASGLADVSRRPQTAPRLARALRSDPLTRDGAAHYMGADGALRVVPARGAPEDVVALAARYDLLRLSPVIDWADPPTWEHIGQLLRGAAARDPASRPVVGTVDDLTMLAPAWFGSGIDETLVAYYHPRDRRWRFGPRDRAFEDYVFWFAAAYRDGLLHPALVNPAAQAPDVLEALASGAAFLGALSMVPDGHPTIGPLPVPRGRDGPGWLRARPWNPLVAAYAVSAASPQQTLAIAALDLLLWSGEETATFAAPRLFQGSDVAGGPTQVYVDAGQLPTAPWARSAPTAPTTIQAVAADLMPHITLGVLEFVTGRRPLREYTTFKDELRDAGSGQLVALLEAHSTALDPSRLISPADSRGEFGR